MNIHDRVEPNSYSWSQTSKFKLRGSAPHHHEGNGSPDLFTNYINMRGPRGYRDGIYNDVRVSVHHNYCCWILLQNTDHELVALGLQHLYLNQLSNVEPIDHGQPLLKSLAAGNRETQQAHSWWLIRPRVSTLGP